MDDDVEETDVFRRLWHIVCGGYIDVDDVIWILESTDHPCPEDIAARYE